MDLNLKRLESAEQGSVAFLRGALANITFLDALQVNGFVLVFLLELFEHSFTRRLQLLLFLFLFVFLLDLLGLLFLFFLGGARHGIQLLFHLLDPREGEVIIDLVFQLGDVLLHIELREVRT